jgi:hypothetical protein
MPTILSIVPEDFSAERTIISTDGVKYLRTEKIKFNEILIPVDKASKKTNSARQGDEDGKHIADLRHSFSNGVDLNIPPPSVEILRDMKEVDGVWKKYRLLDGHHRYAAICEQTDVYVFDVYEIDPGNAKMSRISFQLKCNNHHPQKKSSYEDICSNGSQLVLAKKFCGKDGKLSEYLLSDWIEEVGGYKKGTLPNKTMITRIEAASDVFLPYKTYPDRTATRWVKQNLPSIKLNEDGGHYWIVKKASDRAIMRLLKKDTTEVQYIIINPEPTSKGNVLKARQDLYNYIHSIAKDVWKKTGGQKSISEVFKILYALPQLRDTENMTEPITMDKMNGET